MAGAASSQGAKAAGRHLASLLAITYRTSWTPYAQRQRATEVHLAAVATVLARRLWEYPERAGDVDVRPRQLVDTVWRAVHGRGVSLGRLELFITAFGMETVHADQLRRLWHGLPSLSADISSELPSDPGWAGVPDPSPAADSRSEAMAAGRLLRILRGDRPPSEIASAAEVCEADLLAYEGGKPLVGDIAARLDAALGAEGWIVDRRGAEPRHRADALVHGVAARRHPGRWPAAYAGVVWIVIKPMSGHVERPHDVALQWGPWRRSLAIPLDADGLVLTTDKARDRSGVSVTCTLAVEPEVTAVFGLGDLPDGLPVLDIRTGWRLTTEG